MPKYPVKIDLEAARRSTEARDMAKAQRTVKAKAILNPEKAVARGNRVQAEEARSEGKLIKRTNTGYGSYRNK